MGGDSEKKISEAAMDYKRFDSTIFARIDKNEEIISKVMEICEKENIRLANINALGAVG